MTSGVCSVFLSFSCSLLPSVSSPAPSVSPTAALHFCLRLSLCLSTSPSQSPWFSPSPWFPHFPLCPSLHHEPLVGPFSPPQIDWGCLCASAGIQQRTRREWGSGLPQGSFQMAVVFLATSSVPGVSLGQGGQRGDFYRQVTEEWRKNLGSMWIEEQDSGFEPSTGLSTA